jgi:glycosyltransferase involved in cell wall biosynthesis
MSPETLLVRQTEEAIAPTPISVCHIVNGGAWAGAESYVATLFRALSRCEGVSLSAILLSDGRLAEELRKYCSRVEVIPERGHSWWGLIGKASQVAKTWKPDVLHSHQHKEDLLAVAIAQRAGVARLVRTQHGRPEPFHGLRKLRRHFLLGMDHLTAKYKADAIIAVSSNVADYVATFVGRDKIDVISNGIDLQGVSSSLTARDAKRALGMNPEAPVIGTACRLEPVKRLDLFLAMARSIAGQMPDAQFVIAGQGSQEKPLRQLARDYGLERQVFFLGHRDDIYEVIRAMDLLVISSDHEGLPMTLLEAMALAVPIVSRAVGGIPDALANGSGFLVDSADPGALAGLCLEALRNPSLLRQVAVAAKDRVQKCYSAETTAAHTLQLYRSLLGDGIVSVQKQ